MRKRTIKYTADTIFWYLIYFLPIILFIITVFQGMRNEAFAREFIDSDTGAFYFGNYVSTLIEGSKNYFSTFIYANSVNPIYKTLVSLFASRDTGLRLLSDNNGASLIGFFSYYVSVYIIHLSVDFLLFIPRLCHKWMNAFTRSEE